MLSKDPWIQCGRKRIRWDILYRSIDRGSGESRTSGEIRSDATCNEEEDGECMEVTHAIEENESEEDEDEKSQCSSEMWSEATSNEEEDGERMSETSWGRTRNFILVGFACMGDHDEDFALGL